MNRRYNEENWIIWIRFTSWKPLSAAYLSSFCENDLSKKRLKEPSRCVQSLEGEYLGEFECARKKFLFWGFFFGFFEFPVCRPFSLQVQQHLFFVKPRFDFVCIVPQFELFLRPIHHNHQMLHHSNILHGSYQA